MLRNSSPRSGISDWWYELNQRAKIVLTVLLGLILLALCIGAASVISRALRAGPEPEATATVASQAAATSTALMSPTPAPTRPPTAAPTDTPEPTEPPPPTPQPSPTPSVDSQGDVGAYESGDPVEEAPAGVDVRVASVGPDLRVALQPEEGVPAELAEWVAEGEVLLWITLHEPIPDPPTGYREWLFALDLDGDVETGRPVGSARINPDLGMEVAVALYYSEGYDTYVLVWDVEQDKWAAGPEARYYLGEDRTLVGLALPLETLTQEAEEKAGATVAPEAVKGRAAALARIGDQKVIDFYPDLPD